MTLKQDDDMGGMRLAYEPDYLRRRDKRQLLKMAGQESREEVARKEIAPGLTVVAQHVQDEVFTLEGENGIYPDGVTFNVRKIKDAIGNNSVECAVLKMDISEELYDYTLHNRGVEEARVASFKPGGLGKIGVAIVMPNDSLLMVDGNHRLVRRWREGMKTMRVAIVHWRAVRKFTMRPLPIPTEPLYENRVR